ncbi:MAG: hypothetical protein ABI743_11265, partial [bacterium]
LEPSNATINAAPSSLKNKSGVSQMEFNIPGVTSSIITQVRGTDFTGIVSPGEYWTTYKATFNFLNNALAPTGTYYAVVAVRDDLYGSSVVDPVDVYTREATVQPYTDITTYAVAPVEVLAVPVDCPGPQGPTMNNPTVTPPVDGTMNQGKTWQFQIGNIVRGYTNGLDKVFVDLDWDNNPFNFAPDGGSVPIVGAEPASVTYSTDFSALAPLAAVSSNHRVGFRVVDVDGNCNYVSALITLWPPVTCPGTFGPTLALAATNAPQPQGNNMNFSISNLIRHGQTAITSLSLDYPGYPSVPAQTIPVPGGAEPLSGSFTLNFSDPGFGIFAGDTSVAVALHATDVEGNCNTVSTTVTVQIGAPAPSFTLTPAPNPATVRHGATVTINITAIACPSSSLLDITAMPNWDGVVANYAPFASTDPADTMPTSNTSYNYQNAAMTLPNPGAPIYNFAIRVRNTSGKSTIQSVPVTLNANQAPTAVWNGTAPTTATVGVAMTIAAGDVGGSDPDGALSTTVRISWGDATADFTGALPTTHTYAAAATRTMTLYRRDDGYGPTNGAAPLPASFEGSGVTRNVVVSAPACGCAATAFYCEDFECTSSFGIPAGWALVNATSTASRWGVKVGGTLTSGSPVAGGTHVLEESGITGGSSTDSAYAANGGSAFNCRWGVFSAPITIPNDAFSYTLNVVHRRNYTWVGSGAGNATADGACIFVKSAAGATDPGTTETGAPGALSNLTPIANGPATPITAPFNGLLCTGVINAAGNPFSQAPSMPTTSLAFSQIAGALPAWITSTYNLNAFKGTTIRIYFVHGQTLWAGSGFGCPSPTWNVDNAAGEKIDKVSITTS